MPVLPFQQSDKILKSAQIAQGLGQGVEMLQNPVATITDQVSGVVGGAVSQIDSLIAQAPNPSDIADLTAVKDAVGDLGTQVASLKSHTETLLFGDGAGSPISGGFTSNAGQALAASNLNDTLSSIGGAITEGCELINDFFGSILGAGADLLNGALSAINNAINAISQGINAVLGAAASIIGAVTSIASQITNLILGEIAAFAEWIAKQLDFVVGSFINGALDHPCFGPVVGTVGTAALASILG